VFDEEEKKLAKWKETIEKTDVPQDELELAIKQGFQRAKSVPKVKKRPYVKRGVWSAIVAAILLITVVTSIRVIPAFANAVASIPGMEKVVALIKDNKGLQAAIDNEYYQEINVSNESSGVKITLDGAIADEMNMVLFYTIEFKQNHKSDFFNGVRINGENGEDLKWGGISNKYADDYHTNKKSTNSLEIDFQEPLGTNNVVLEFDIIEGSGETETIKLPFTVDLSEMQSKKYELNEEIIIDGQSIMIKDVTISPVRTSIKVIYDTANTMEIFGFEDLEIVDEKGKIWSSIVTGTTASSTEAKPNEVIYYLQSNYFEKPKNLYLKFHKLMAMDKNEAYVLIDTNNKQIIKQPKDVRFSNLTIVGDYLSADFRGEQNFFHSPLSSSFSDLNKNTFRLLSWSGSPNGEIESTLGMDMPMEDYKSPVRFQINGYPSYIEGDAEIKIK
jgi:hypothetical protein